MRAAIYNGPNNPITIEQIAEPVPLAGELLLEVARCGICGSDLSMTSGSHFDYPVGQCFGHEFSGTVIDLGKDTSGWRVGDKVACMPKSSCGKCEACRGGRLLLCPYGEGLTRGFAERIAIPAQAAVRLPATLSLADGALVEPMACGLRALTSAGLQAGDRVLVLGAGAMALSVVWWARRLGAGKIVVASRSKHRSETCYDFGADAVHSFAEDDPSELQALLGGAPHIVAECVGKEGMLPLALDHVGMGGTVISMGMCTKPDPILPIMQTFKEARIIFPLAYSVEQFEQTARVFDEVGFNPERMVSEVLPLEQLASTLEALRAGKPALKIHIDPRMPA